MIPANEALARLRDGNQRFIAGNPTSAEGIHPAERLELVSGQSPFAVILGCSDSRVPAEIVFDQGLGDLFVIRIAGNIAAPSHIGSVEFAVENLGARLVVVLGHTSCGAVSAVVHGYGQPGNNASPAFQVIVDHILPAVDQLKLEEPGLSGAELIERSVRANVMASVRRLNTQSAILKRHLYDRELIITGAEYCLETGIVEFFQEQARRE